MIGLLTLLILLICNGFTVANTEYAARDFDLFLKQFVSFEQQPAFKDYYANLMVRERDRVDRAKGKQVLLDLEKNGKASLETQAPTYFAQLKKDKHSERAQRKLYIRYGAYQEFLKNEIKTKNSFFVKARGYVTGAKTRVANWFGSWRKSKTVA
ncbi:MAG TPA: hypothetical protein VHO47_02495 [Candidatus Babeliales bacterium]|nr:hypothetical protein [Candidatus Babeliales bacterium]